MNAKRCAVGLLLWMLAGHSQANTIIFSSEPDFLAVAGPTVTEGFEGLPLGSFAPPPDGTPVSVVTSELTAISVIGVLVAESWPVNRSSWANFPSGMR